MGKKVFGGFANDQQYSIQMYDYATQVGQLDSVSNQLVRSLEIDLLKQNGVKFNENDLIFATRDARGKVVWLENGNEKSGLFHIIARHAKDFYDVYGVREKDIPGFIKNLVVSGKMIGERKVIRNGRAGFERTYVYDDKHFTVSGVGTNGYIVSVYPFRKDEK